ncbi:thiol-disulfide oxidoreductase ResA [Paenibacillus sonchi]|uniref:Thiol-disulfide oxidoreductase ResA n=2 Tax=Paenibacillus sonchi group TaxID=2044880 RepID=A0A974PBC3_9BACL|nr:MULTISPECIES: thiol-disulfide oxidoreductase ResA [Paenibacillus sonchi group]QQZ60725.1 thiol-disulfide oxidoreductase ResA [Paenibacillus sonchi]CQR56926.1 alkyl hydroperoxide reductase/ Thiol specific antioxidant/ Mal allergen [Paenibacillus riograndensis SBR5]
MGKARKPVQIIILFVIILLGGYAISSSVFGGDGKPREGGKAPSFELLGLDGLTHTLDEYKGKSVVLNFWGSWCAPCVKEMPALQAQWEKWKEQGVVVVGINVGEDQMTVENFVKQVDINFPVVMDTGRDAVRSYGVSPLPTTFFINTKGRVDSIHIGQLDLSTLDDQIRKLVEP